MNEIIENLYKERIERGITLSKVAEHLGVSEGAVSHWERFRRTPKVDQLYRWAEYFDFEITWILVRKD